MPFLPTNFALISQHNFLSSSSTHWQLLLTLNPVLSKRNVLKYPRLHRICSVEAFCRAPHHSRKQLHGKWTVKIISLSETLCHRIYCQQWILWTRTRSLLIYPNSATLEHQSFCHFLVSIAWDSCDVSKLSNWVLSGHNYFPMKPRYHGVPSQRI